MPLDEALAIARQLADALESAHDQGIIHRDLKPANIKVRDDGTVKILDFGLAKALDTAPASIGSASMSPTLSIHATQAGMILGTAAYMAPEQARGRAVDKRADIWAFGCVLYELLTGARAFPGDDVTDTIVSVVSKEPPWEALPRDSRVTTLIRRCLKKDPKARMRDIGEARLQIDEILNGTAIEAADLAVPAPRSAKRVWLWRVAAGTGIAVAAVAATWFAMRQPPSTPETPTRYTVVPPPSHPLQLQGQDRDIAVSPDGTSIV